MKWRMLARICSRASSTGTATPSFSTCSMTMNVAHSLSDHWRHGNAGHTAPPRFAFRGGLDGFIAIDDHCEPIDDVKARLREVGNALDREYGPCRSKANIIAAKAASMLAAIVNSPEAWGSPPSLITL